MCGKLLVQKCVILLVSTDVIRHGHMETEAQNVLLIIQYLNYYLGGEVAKIRTALTARQRLKYYIHHTLV